MGHDPNAGNARARLGNETNGYDVGATVVTTERKYWQFHCNETGSSGRVSGTPTSCLAGVGFECRRRDPACFTALTIHFHH
jgi:hypothetical protein